MAVTIQELIDNNGSFVAIIDYLGEVYQGYLHYEPLTNSQFPIQIWTDDCCFISFLQLDDAEQLIPDPLTPCVITLPCCSQCLPNAMLMDISGTNAFCSCLVNEAYLLDWNSQFQRYQFDYPGICDCTTLHAYLACSGSQWVVYLALKNEMGLTCVDGNNLNFPLDCATMTGTGTVIFSQTGTCACGPCANDTITITFSPLS